MTTTAILEELNHLPFRERLAIAEALLRGLKEDLERSEATKSSVAHSSDLALAAKALLADYLKDAELTPFRSLDEEEFHGRG